MEDIAAKDTIDDDDRHKSISLPPPGFTLTVTKVDPTLTLDSPGKVDSVKSSPPRRGAVKGEDVPLGNLELPTEPVAPRRGAVKGDRLSVPTITLASLGPPGVGPRVSQVLTQAFAGLEITPRQRFMENRRKQNKSEMAGAFCDFITRMNPESPLDRRLSVGAKEKRRSIENAGAKGNRELGFKMALSAVQRERLLAEFMEVITKFKKSCNDPEWKSGLKEFQKQAMKLLSYKAEYSCLNSEVNIWLFQRRLLRKAAPERSEVFEERRDRLKDFWSQYHATSKKAEIYKNSPTGPAILSQTSSSGSLNRTMNTSTQKWSYGNNRKDGIANANSSTSKMKTSTSLPVLSTTQRGPSFNLTRNGLRAPQRGRLGNRGQTNKISFDDFELPPINGESPSQRYMRMCQEYRIVPTLLPFMTGHSLKFNACGKELVDNDLIVATVMIPSMQHIEEVNLAGNGLLTDRSLVPFMEKLILNPAVASLRHLDLSQCHKVGQSSLQLLVSLLSSREDTVTASKLQTLDLSGVAISARVLHPLCKAIRLHKSLKTVNMVDIGLGKNGGAHKIIDDLLGSSSIEELDLGWNSFGPEEFAHLGERLAAMQKLVSLRLSNCSVASNYFGSIPIICPIVYFIEQLSRNKTVKFLDVSLNRIDFRAALMLEDALGNHQALRELNVSNNPLGVIGMRSCLRLLSRSESGLTHFICDSCSTGSKADDATDAAQIFSASNPGGRYQLDLVRPYHRALLRMLYKTSEGFGVSPADSFLDITPSSYQHPAKIGNGIWPVQTNGKMTVTFSLEKGLEMALKGIPDGSFKAFLRSHDELMRMKPAFHKTVPLFAQWKSINGLELEQRVFLAALSKDFLITYPQLEALARSSRQLTSDIILSLLPCVIGGDGVRYLTLLLTPSLGEYIGNHAKMANLIGFAPENPTGPYSLDLGMSADYAVAESLFLLDRWEVGVGRRLQRRDVSQRGNRSQIRNPRFQDRPLYVSGITSVAEWNMPECDVLEFDYVSSKRPNPDAQVIDEVTFNKILSVLQSSDCKPSTMVGVLRTVSEHIFLTALQLRSLLGAFLESWDRAEVFVIFFMRVLDMYNEKVFRVRFEDPDDLEKLRARLGYVTSLAFIQPEQSFFKLNLKYHDERLAANLILALCAKESAKISCVRNPKYIHADGTEDPFALGVPRAWETFEKMPTSGVFEFSYNCAPESRCFGERRKLMQEYGYWQTNVPENEIMWWSALTEAPTDVLEFLEFLVAHFKDVYQAFEKIDGEGGNGVLTLREFEEGVKQMECKKFQGGGPEKELRRIHAVFRYLDPSGEGEVSRDEWGVMEQLWKEMQLSIREFVCFLKNQFDVDDTSECESSGSEDGKDFLDVAFEYLDDDGSGEIDEKEWQEAVRERLKYFGPCACIFGFLDKDDEGTICIEEFKGLRQFEDPEKESST